MILPEKYVQRIERIRRRHQHREAERQTNYRRGYRKALNEVWERIEDERLRVDIYQLLQEIGGDG